MKKLHVVLLILLVIAGIALGLQRPQPNSGEPSVSLTEPEARSIAEGMCIKGGAALGLGIHNKDNRTWSFEANLNATREGCTSSCVVSEMTKTAEVIWRCADIKPVACTMEARQCPDGSYVGRSGPNCEFVCPK